MKKIIIFILLSLSIFAISDEKREQVLKDFNAFKSSYSIRDGQETVKYFTPDSIELYDNLLKMATKEIGSEKIGFLESMVIMGIQNKLSVEEIKKMTGKEIIVWSINEGANSFENFDILPVFDIYDKDGYAYVVIGYEKDNIAIKMEESEGIWKVNLPYIFDIINKNFEKLFETDGYKDLFSKDGINDLNKNVDYYGSDYQESEKNQAPRTKKNYY